MGDPVELAFRRAARRLLPDSGPVVVAVSGGGDSTALMHLAARWARGTAAPRIHVAHLDHGLRDDSEDDRSFVEGECRRAGLGFTSERAALPELRRRDESPEEAARRVRRKFLQETAERLGAPAIATGHTLDDQAETVLARLVRGAGSTALCGIAELGPGPFVRPLLGLEREALRRWLARHGLVHREDPSNRDPRFERNRIRREILPLLERSLNPRVARHLVLAADRLREDALLLDRLAEQRFGELRAPGSDDVVAVDAAALAEDAPPIARRVVRIALGHAGVDRRRISGKHLEAVLALARGARGRRVDLPNRRCCRRTSTELRIESPRDEAGC